jgi:hypothetical protein
MARFVRVIGLVMALALGASGCWLQDRADTGRTSWMPGETALTAANVGGVVELWRDDFSRFVPDSGQVSAPIVMGENVYATVNYGGTTGNLVRVTAATGAVQFRVDVFSQGGDSGPAFFSPPTWHDNTVLVGNVVTNIGMLGIIAGGRDAFDATTGAPVSGPPTGGQGGIVHEAVEADGTVVQQRLVAFTNAPQGTDQVIDWRVTALTTVNAVQVPNDFAIVGDRLAGGDGLRALGWRGDSCTPLSGRFLSGCAADWSATLPGHPVAGPAAVGGTGAAYVDDAGTLSVLDPSTGAVQWTGALGGPASGPAAVTADVIYVPTSDGRLVAFAAAGCGAATCPKLWETPLGAPGASPDVAPVVAGELVYAGTAGGTVIVAAAGGCGADTCAPLTTLQVGGPVNGLVVDGGRVLVGTSTARLVAFGLPPS